MMKSKKLVAYASAIALLSMGLQACTSDDDANEAPVVTGEIVKTQLAISIPQSSSASARTRMSGDAVQADQDFNGIDKFYIYPMSTSNQVDDEYVVGDDDTFIGLRLENEAALSSVGAANDHWIDAEIPVGVNSVLFYGKATPTATPTDKFADGSLAATFDAGTISTHSPKDYISFNLEQIRSNLDVSALDSDAPAQALLALLNGVESASYTPSGEGATPIYWRSLAADYPQQNLLKPLYDKYVGLSTASSEAIRLMMEDLYNSLEAFNANDMSPVIRAAITGKYSYGNTNIKLKATVAASNTYTLAWDTEGGCQDPEFPVCYNLPAGAVALTFEATNNSFKFSGEQRDGLTVTAYNRYAYPAQLYYFANSPIRTANTSQKANVTAGTTWAAFLADNYADGNRVVTANTQSLAVKNQIEYGVANLETRVRIGQGVIKDSQDNTITLTGDDEGLTWTGLLIGDQKGVDWKFEPVAANTSLTIYDRDILGKGKAGTAVTSSWTNENYTLVLQTEQAEADGEDAKKGVVTIALEFKNTSGHDFFGYSGQLIPAGSTFYLLAELNPKTEVEGKVDGVSATGNRVFMQDYVTKAELTITSLAKAYNVVPDLRTPQLELGMSVNLEWKAGIKFTQNIGGGGGGE